MVLILSRKQHSQLLDWAKNAKTLECCGLLLGQSGVVARVVLAANVADDPARHFEIDPGMLITAEKHARNGRPSILGYFHSHPNGLQRPSVQDAASAAEDGRVWLIIAGGAISAWFPGAGAEGRVQFEPAKLIVEG